MPRKKVLITGVTGFIGHALSQHLLSEEKYDLHGLVRKACNVDCNVNKIVGALSSGSNIDKLVADVDVVIHLAGRAHIINETMKDPYSAFAEVNVEATRRLVTASARCGVKRFIYISTTKVCGEETEKHKPIQETHPLMPYDDYAKTKAQAESIVRKVCDEHGMEFVIIRPPLVYGPNVKANFKRLIAISVSSFPLPLDAVSNLRSLVYIENLASFIECCISHPDAANQTFFVSDDHDISTSDLIKRLAAIQGYRAKLIPVPERLLRFVLKLLKPDLQTKLCSNFQVNISKAKELLGWQPPYSLQEGLEKTVKSIL